MAVVTPIPNASESPAASVNPGRRRSERGPWAKFLSTVSGKVKLRPSRRDSFIDSLTPGMGSWFPRAFAIPKIRMALGPIEEMQCV